MKFALYLAAFGWIAAAQETVPDLRAWQLFYTPERIQKNTKKKVTEPEKVPANAPYLALRYCILQSGTAGPLVEVNPGKTFHSGDRFKLKLTSNSAGYLYVVMQGSKDNWEVLYPLAAAPEEHRQLAAGEPIVVPADDNFRFDKDPGAERLFVVLSRNPEPGFERLIQAVKQRGSNEIPKEKIAGLREKMGERGIVRERAAEGDRDQCTYAANIKPDPSSRVIAGIGLKHE